MSWLFGCLGLCTEVDQVFGDEALDIGIVSHHVSFGHAYIHVGTLGEELWSTCGIVENEQRHENLCSHLIQTAGEEILCFLATCLLDIVNSLAIEFHQFLHTFL